jgi:hypothetical protein
MPQLDNSASRESMAPAEIRCAFIEALSDVWEHRLLLSVSEVASRKYRTKPDELECGSLFDVDFVAAESLRLQQISTRRNNRPVSV